MYELSKGAGLARLDTGVPGRPVIFFLGVHFLDSAIVKELTITGAVGDHRRKTPDHLTATQETA